MRKLIVSGLVLLALGTMGARAATVMLEPLDSSGIGVGETFMVDLVGRSFDPATETTVGGGTKVSFNPNIIKLVSVDFELSIWESGQTLPDPLPAGTGTVDLLVVSVVNPVSGDFPIATLSFEALATGLTPLDLGPSDLSSGEGVWRTANDEVIAVTFTDGSVLVPLPPALWLFLTGIGALVVVGRRRRA